MHIMYDQLVDYDTKGKPGTTMIPDAAAAMPTVTNGGKTYTFKLRHDVHFWNGRLVTSADWVYSFERIINPKTQAGAASFWMNIVGAKEFAANPSKAKHVSGIKALGQFGLEIDLIAPDASFLNVLAMPFGSVVDKNQIAKYGKTLRRAASHGHRPLHVPAAQAGAAADPGAQSPLLHAGCRPRRQDRGRLRGRHRRPASCASRSGQADLDGDLPADPAAEFLNVLQRPVWSKRVVKQVQVAT